MVMEILERGSDRLVISVSAGGGRNLEQVPELPEVESVRRQLEPRLVGRTLLRVSATPQARFAGLEFAAGRRIEALDRRGKYLLAELGDEHAGREHLELVMHLGMTGSFRFREDIWPDGPWRGDPYVRATLHLDGAMLDFRDVRRFGRLTVVPRGDYRAVPTLRLLGPEPLSDAFDPDRFAQALARTNAAVKPFLLSQRPVAGVGNIYADEALWRARIHPRSRRVGRRRAHALWSAVRAVLSEAIEREGTSFSDYLMVNGQSGRNAAFLEVYGQAGTPCRRCGTELSGAVVGGRGTTYCRRCQSR
jgi:formamidopyrimidine-DNA glycosylase